MDPVFLLTSIVTLASSILCVTRRNPVYSAVWLLVSFLSFAVLYLSLAAPFLAAIHVLVYTGAILVLFLFVIMLLNLKDDELGEEYPAPARILLAVAAAGLFAGLAWPIAREPVLAVNPAPTPATWGSVESVGLLLFEQYGLPFELVSLLIIVAMFGAMVLSKRKLWTLRSAE
ncbi:MAG: NADH-quinone oxidoreductase subunit J [Deltaproteobacteria bacterium]|nr:NADH-quinone oxidoreductase subunit J [Deltaproteobacteria bacterium]